MKIEFVEKFSPQTFLIATRLKLILRVWKITFFIKKFFRALSNLITII